MISKHKEHEGAESETHANAEKRDTEKLPLVVTIRNSDEAASQQEEAERHEKARNDSWVTYATLWLSAATTLLAVFTFSLWRATGKLVIGANDTSRKQLRAYVSVLSIEYVGQGQALRRLAINIKNFGSTPADRVFVSAVTYEQELSNWGERWDEVLTQNYSDGGQRLLHPQQEWDAFEFDPVHTSDLDGTLWIMGRIIYRDAFEQHWECAFHFRRRANGRLQAMDATYNYEKKLERPPT